MDFNHETHILLRKLIDIAERNEKLTGHALHELRAIRHELSPPTPSFPTAISFKEITMLPPVAGNTLVYTGTLAPAGSAFTANTTFSAVSSDPNATASVDATGLIVTIVLGASFVDNPASPFNVVYTASDSTQTPPASITATITPSIPTPFPSSISFIQTT
jgi:hypothetical protein